MNVDAPARCEQCSAPIRQPKTGRRRRYCGGTCRKAAYRARTEAWTFQQANDPQFASLPTMEDLYASEHGDFDLKAWWQDCEATPSPEESTVTHVSETIREAQAVAAALRRHGLAAPGMLAVQCAAVASALDKALAEQFGDVL